MTTRRGLILPMVLVVILLCASSVVSLERHTLRRSVVAKVHHDLEVADALLSALHRPIVRWLTEESAQVILSPESKTPMLLVFIDQWDDPVVGRVKIAINAWDQRGMEHISLRGFSSRGPHQEDMLRARRILVRADRPGLDQLTHVRFSTDDRVRRASIIPGGQDDAHTWSVGAEIATHPRRASGSGPPTVNVMTAPHTLLETSLPNASGLIDSIMQARRDGRLWAWGQDISDRSRGGTPVRLVTRSDAWAMRIDIEYQAVRRSWWTVYQRDSGAWRCVQRFLIRP